MMIAVRVVQVPFAQVLLVFIAEQEIVTHTAINQIKRYLVWLKVV
jgi:hypothetical protein